MANRADNKIQLIDALLEDGLTSEEKTWLLNRIKEKHTLLNGFSHHFEPE